MSQTDEKTLVLSSSFEEMERLQPFVKKLKEWADFGDEDFDRILLAISEAVNNAIIHGNKQDPDKNAYIKAGFQGRTLTVTVEDEGSGFNPSDLPDPLKEENLLNEGGRGIYLIKQYADEVRFSENGTKITIIFHLDS